MTRLALAAVAAAAQTARCAASAKTPLKRSADIPKPGAFW